MSFFVDLLSKDNITILAGIITIFGVVRILLKGPRVDFILQKKECSLHNEKQEIQISMLLAHVTNKKKRFIGDVAKKLSGGLFYQSDMGLAAVKLPWLVVIDKSTKINEPLNTNKEIQRALEQYLFDRKVRDVPQGRAETLVVAYGIEKTKKMYFASTSPLDMRLPPHEKSLIDFTCFPIRLEIAGKNLPSTTSEFTFIYVKSWNIWSVPKKITTLHTPSRFRNLLLRIGIGKKIKIIKTIKTY